MDDFWVGLKNDVRDDRCHPAAGLNGHDRARSFPKRRRQRDHPARIEYGDCSPMVTHLHLRPGQPPEEEDLTAQQRKRARSLGSEADALISIPAISSSQTDIQPSGRGSLQEEPLSPSESTDEDSKHQQRNPTYISVLYGLINAFIVLPVLMSFGSIIYRDQAFAPYMPVLIKLTVVSGMVHQLCFTAFSSLPFAVGQVQDAGLIFLSSMAGDMVRYCQSRGYSDDVILATVTIGLSLATALLGIGVVLLGQLRLAQYVQRLPTPVIGGYLAYIGFFCGVSGLALMASGGGSILTGEILWNNLRYILPGLVGGILIYALVRQIRHMAVLPTCIVVILTTFYLGLWLSDMSIQDATDEGWIRPSDPPPVWYHTWDYLRFNKVAWEALPSQTLTLISMIFVVALSSSLDVAAIELELQRPLNYNSELTMVGLSNVVSGLTGGYTGSYIFSQSIFCLRAGIRSRLAGFILAFVEMIVILLPFPILAYVPNFFFGSLLIMICVDLLHEWLWEVRYKLTTIEYSVCLATFVLIQLLGVEYGIFTGVGLYLVAAKLQCPLRQGTLEEVSLSTEQVTDKANNYYGTL